MNKKVFHSAASPKASVSGAAPKNISKTDAYWNNVLEAEKQRLAYNTVERLVPVDEIMLDESSEDDDVPIVDTLTSKKSNLSLLVEVATHPVSSPTIRKKKQPKVCNRNPNRNPQPMP